MAVLAVIRSWRAGCEHRRLPSGTRVGCGRLGRSHTTAARATPRAVEQSHRRRSTDDHGIRAPRAIAEQECCARSARCRRGRRPAAAVTVATTDASESRFQGTAPGSEEAAHRRQATASPTSRLNAESEKARVAETDHRVRRPHFRTAHALVIRSDIRLTTDHPFVDAEPTSKWFSHAHHLGTAATSGSSTMLLSGSRANERAPTRSAARTGRRRGSSRPRVSAPGCLARSSRAPREPPGDIASTRRPPRSR